MDNQDQVQESFQMQDSLERQEGYDMQVQEEDWNEELYRRLPFHGFGGFHGGFGRPFFGGFHGGFGRPFFGGFGRPFFGGFGRPFFGYGGFGLPFLGGLAAGGLLASTLYNPYGYGYGYGYDGYYPPYYY